MHIVPLPVAQLPSYSSIALGPGGKENVRFGEALAEEEISMLVYQRLLVPAGRRRKALVLALLVICTAFPFVLLALRQFLASVGQTAQPVDEFTIAGRPAAVWKPTGPAPANGYPLIVFSHGFTGCGMQSVFLTAGLARAGYLVLAPDHHDAACGPNHTGRLFEKLSTMRSVEPFQQPELWSDATYRDRGDDVKAILDEVLSQPTWQGVRIDPNRVGLAGHSLGGYTVLALAGAWPSWRDSRVKAVLALSPYCAPLLQKGDLQHLNVPVMYQGGTLDFGISPFIRKTRGPYDQSSSPKYFVDLAGAGHFAWTNLNKTYQPVINRYAIAFFDRYLKGTTNPDPLPELVNPPWPTDVKAVKFAAH